jgi:predicted transposase/invertase (TIGR01784 family)
MSNPHDAYFKQLMSQPERAGLFIREHVPAEVVVLLGVDPPVLEPQSFVDDDLREHHSDLLFRMRLRGAQSAETFVYILIEHKSAPDAQTRLQLLRYMTRIWEHARRQGAGLPLTPILPIVVHQGPELWPHSTSFADLFGDMNDVLRRFQPEFDHVLIDLGRIPDAALSVQTALRMRLKAMKYRRRADLLERLDYVLRELPDLERDDVLIVLSYMQGVAPERMLKALKTIEEQRGERNMNLLEAMREGYRQEGLKEGLKEGRQEGQARILLRQATRRFGELDEATRQHILAADSAKLEVWLDAIIDAETLSDIFNAP